MTEVVSFRPTDEIEEEIQRERDLADDDLSRSLAAKGLAGEAVEARNTPFWYRRDMSRRHRAQIENARDDGEEDDDVVKKLLVEAVGARREDGLDAIGASDELREAVEERREEGESLDGAVERLLRTGVEGATDGPDLKERAVIGAAVAGVALTFVLAYVRYGPVASGLLAVGVVLYVSFYPTLDAAADRALGVLRSVRG
jgi:hypothetical protein